MKFTLVQFALEGLVDSDHPPRVFQGHLDKEQCVKLAAEYGSGYPVCALVECESEEGAAFYASYSNDKNPQMNEDGSVSDTHKGHLEVWFHHAEQEPQPQGSR